MRHGIYGSPEYLKELNGKAEVILFRGSSEQPEWVQNYFPDADVTMRVADVCTMFQAVGNHIGLARMPYFIGDAEPSIRRLNLKLAPAARPTRELRLALQECEEFRVLRRR